VKSALGLLAGLLAFDLLLNLPGVTPSAPFAPLMLFANHLAPSIDLLVVAAVLMVSAGAGPRAKAGIRVGLAAAVALLLGMEVLLRLGPGAVHAWSRAMPWGLLALAGAGAVAALAAVGVLSWLLAGMLYNGFARATWRSVFLAVVAGCTILQVLTRVRIFAPSALPRLAREVTQLLG
jgi:hypothetical protein